MRKLIISFTLAFSLFIGANTVGASTTHHVQSGDTLWKLANNYGVPVNAIKSANNKTSDTIFIGERLTIPSSVTAYEKRLLAQLVTAEAKGEPYAGQVAVATVVLNRVDSNQFPNTVHNVIYQPEQFTPVSNSAINQPATASAIRAVDEALAFRGQGRGSLFFYNPKIATNHWIATRQHTITIGNHVFAK
ncbi:peptidoglycan-binding protein [Anaerobacillus alkalilacustris]|uniref:Peptidoglycan-binding protein n=1 Tax=Anaerobacillus alkalilacustris TaxID=393763 RepID=A0A1S2LE50_9BACI|nr:cell wall hydrolase [Anaerobacillus alkalilacustris]OIJ10792.1 peptidoglycan-binding protein [Anaerobacillus alkalilacustris]